MGRGRRPSPRLRAVLITVGIAFALILVAGVIAGVRLARISSDLRRSRDLIESASANVEQGRLAPARGQLAQAEALLVTSNDQLYSSPELDAVGWVPVLHQNLDSLRSSVGVALRLVSGGRKLLDLTQTLEDSSGKLQVPLKGGTLPLTIVRDTQQEAEQLAASLPGSAEATSSSWLLGPVKDLQTRVLRESDKRRVELDNVQRALDLLVEMSGGHGSRRYLVAVANTAEMRGAGGMVLSYGVLEGNDGKFTLGQFGNIDELAIGTAVDPQSVNVAPSDLDRWKDLEPNRLWRNATLSPDFQLDSKLMMGMYQQATGNTCDGVIQIDPAGLAAILQGVGPIDVDGVGTVTADNVVDVTLNKAYIDFPNRDQRQEVMKDVAHAAFDKLINGDFPSLRPLGEAVVKAALGRHIMFWTSHTSAEDQTRFFHADGSLPDPATRDYTLLTVQNVSKNKLDYYVDSSLVLTGTRPASGAGSMNATITITNSAPPGIASTYITGAPVRGQPYAVYRGIVSLYLPDGTTLAGSNGSDPAPLLTSDAGRTVVTYDVVLGAGESSTVNLALKLVPRPSNQPYTLTAIPIGRVRPMTLSVDIDLGGGRRITTPVTPLERVTVLGGPSPGAPR
jgi:Protein of unknown function (DUF4012)